MWPWAREVHHRDLSVEHWPTQANDGLVGNHRQYVESGSQVLGAAQGALGKLGQEGVVGNRPGARDTAGAARLGGTQNLGCITPEPDQSGPRATRPELQEGTRWETCGSL